MQVFITRDQYSVGAADQFSADALLNMDKGKVYKAEISMPRNLAFHRKFFALMKLVFDAQDRYATEDDLLDALKIATGHAEIHHVKKGLAVYRTKSISFAKMDEPNFRKFWDKCVMHICTEILPGAEKKDLEARINDIIGG